MGNNNIFVAASRTKVQLKNSVDVVDLVGIGTTTI